MSERERCHCGCFVHAGPCPASLRRVSLEDGFWSRVERGADDACWLWQGWVDRDGYGMFKAQGRNHRAHRVSWLLHFGELPADRMVCHRCDVPGCVNPAHLFLGDALVNNRDRARKGRGLVGERNPRATLADDLVEQIRALCDQGWGGSDIGRAFGVDKTMVSRIRLRKGRFAE